MSLITRDGGNIIYTGNGSITGIAGAGGTIALQATIAPGADNNNGNISIGSAALPIQGATFDGASGIVTTALAGSTAIYLHDGTVRASDPVAGDAIRSSSAGGNITMVLTGNTALVNGSGGVNGVFGIHVVGGSTGDVTIVSNANMGDPVGVAMNRGISVGDPAGGAVNGKVNITLTGGTIAYAPGTVAGEGVFAQTNVGDIDVTMQNLSTITGAGAGTSGIFANTLGAGSINVTTQAGSTITGGGAGSAGINAVVGAAGTGAITVMTAGAISLAETGVNMQILNAGNASSISYINQPNGNIQATATGVNATTVGTGNIFIVNNGTVTATGDALTNGGINSSATTGNISITSAGAVSSANDAIRAQTTTGSINITTGAAQITGDTNGGGAGAAIFATSTGGNIAIATGSGNLTGSEPGSVPPGTGGVVHATTTGNGNIGMTIGTGGVTGSVVFPVDGITTSAANGQTTIVTFGTVASGAAGAGNGINATATGTGGITIETHALVTGTNNGILTSAQTGATSITTNTGSNVTAGVGINVSAAGAGAVTIETHGTVTGTGAAPGGVSGDAIHVVQTGAGAVTVQTFATVTGNTANVGSDGIDISGGGTGPVLVHTYAPVSGDPAIIVNMAGPVTIVTDASSPTTANGPAVISGTSTASTVLVDVSASVTNTGVAGDGIFTSTTGGGAGAATANTVTVRPNVTVTGIGAGFAAINANTVNGTITVNVDQGATATNTTGIGVRLNTGATGTATLNNQGTVLALGTAANPSILFVSNNTGTPITINNGPTGLITNTIGVTGWAVTPGTPTPSANAQPININNQGIINGRIALGAGANTFTNLSGGVWNTSSTSDFGANPGNTLNNNLGAIINTSGSAAAATVINGIQNINNGGVINAGAALADSTTFNANAGQIQRFINSAPNNTAIINVIGCGNAACPGNTAGLILTGAAGSSFSNSVGGNGGIINLQADHTAISPNTNAVTMSTAIFGSSDLNYSYTFGPAYHFAGDVNGAVQSPNSRLWVDTFLGGPGATSDRLVFSGNASGSTRILVNDVNAGAGSFNPVGITVVALGGSSNGSNFVVDPLSKNWVNFGPLGAIDKGFFLYPLVYVPGGATGNGSPNGNAYKFLGVPGPFAFNFPVAATGAQTIFQETADVWEDRQIETRNCIDRGLIVSGQASGAGAGLSPVFKSAPALLPDCGLGIWTKLVGSSTRRNAIGDLNQVGFQGQSFDNSYSQRTEGFLAGLDYGHAELTSPFDSIVFSVMGGYISSFLDFNSPNSLRAPLGNTSFKYSGGTFGASVTYMNRGFFIDALLKGDFLTMDVTGIPGAFCAPGASVCTQDVNAKTWGTVDNIGYRFQIGRYFIEPLGTLMWTRTSIDNLNLPGAAVVAQFNTANRVDIGGGARMGGVVMDDKVHYVEASFTGRFWDTVSSDQNSVTVQNLGPAFTLTDNFKRSYAETAFQLDWINRYSGLSSFAKVGAKFNSELQTYTAKAGLRYGF